MSKLKPCPLCNKNDRLHSLPRAMKLTEDMESIVDWVVTCASCGIHVYAQTQKEAEEKWNTRVREDELEMEIIRPSEFSSGLAQEGLAQQSRATTAEMQVKEALAEAVKIIYLDDNSDYGSTLWRIVQILGGNEAVDLLESDDHAAFVKYSKIESGGGAG